MNKIDENILIKLVKNGDEEAFETLLSRYDKLIHFYSKFFYSKFLEYDDFLNIARFGLWKACIEFKFNKKTKFCSFAIMVIKESLSVAMKNSKNSFNSILNNSISLDDYQEFQCGLPSFELTPEKKFENIEKIGEIFDRVIDNICEAKLTDQQKKVFLVLLDENSKTKDKCKDINLTISQFNNSLHRVRDKLNGLREYLQSQLVV